MPSSSRQSTTVTTAKRPREIVGDQPQRQAQIARPDRQQMREARACTDHIEPPVGFIHETSRGFRSPDCGRLQGPLAQAPEREGARLIATRSSSISDTRKPFQSRLGILAVIAGCQLPSALTGHWPKRTVHPGSVNRILGAQSPGSQRMCASDTGVRFRHLVRYRSSPIAMR